MKDVSALGERVKKERKAQKLTQTELAHLSGVGINFVSQLENGKPSLHFNKVLMVMQTLGLKFQIQYLRQ